MIIDKIIILCYNIFVNKKKMIKEKKMKIENIFKNFRKGNSVLTSENYEIDLEYLKNYLFEKTKYLMIASLGLWNGRTNGYKISDNFLDSFGEYENFECFSIKETWLLLLHIMMELTTY